MSKKKKKEFKQLAVGEEASESLQFVRARWTHWLRWIVFLFVCFLYLLLFLKTYDMHVIQHRGFLLQEVIIYCICTIMMIPVIPSVVLEVDRVEIDKEGLVLHNLLFRRREAWSDIVKFIDPKLLKFAILKTRGFFYLLNRRDLPNFDKLVETIQQKNINAQN